jgi:hypothetical protein
LTVDLDAAFDVRDPSAGVHRRDSVGAGSVIVAAVVPTPR